MIELIYGFEYASYHYEGVKIDMTREEWENLTFQEQKDIFDEHADEAFRKGILTEDIGAFPVEFDVEFHDDKINFD